MAPWCDRSTLDAERLRTVCPRVRALLGSDDPFRGFDTDGETNKKDFEDLAAAAVTLYPGVGHFIVEVLPEPVTKEILDFISITHS